MKLILSYLPVHLIKPNPHIALTLIKTFSPTVLVRNTFAACNVRLAVTSRQFGPYTPMCTSS